MSLFLSGKVRTTLKRFNLQYYVTSLKITHFLDTVLIKVFVNHIEGRVCHHLEVLHLPELVIKADGGVGTGQGLQTGHGPHGDAGQVTDLTRSLE